MPQLANLPEWNLNDLYAGPDAPALSQDIQKAEADASTFAAQYQGKLASLDAQSLAN
jgi:oligoendopeptidase F